MRQIQKNAATITALTIPKQSSNPNGRVSIDLLRDKKELEMMATKAGTTATNLARILIRDGLAKLATGEFTITPLAIESPEDGGDYAQRVLHNRWMMAKGKRFN